MQVSADEGAQTSHCSRVSNSLAQASCSGVAIDRVGLPALSVYRAGDTMHVFAALELELGERFSFDDVEW